MANREEQLKQITEQLEQGVAEIFTSEKYTESGGGWRMSRSQFAVYQLKKKPELRNLFSVPMKNLHRIRFRCRWQIMNRCIWEQ